MEGSLEAPVHFRVVRRREALGTGRKQLSRRRRRKRSIACRLERAMKRRSVWVVEEFDAFRQVWVIRRAYNAREDARDAIRFDFMTPAGKRIVRYVPENEKGRE
jgi:hypothetical protein